MSYCGSCISRSVSATNVHHGRNEEIWKQACGYSSGVHPSTPFTLPVLYNFLLDSFSPLLCFGFRHAEHFSSYILECNMANIRMA
jgi:hypothetical protein